MGEQGSRTPSASGALENQTSEGRVALAALIREDWDTHGRDWTSAGLRALVVYRVDSARRRSRPVVRIGALPLVRFLRTFVRNHYGIDIPPQATIGRRLTIAHQGAIVVHPNTRIGDDCLIRQGCTLGAVESRNVEEAPILGNGVKLGAGVIIIGRVHVGDNTRIGPNAVVTKNIAANSVVMAPAPRVFDNAVTSDP
jgi:serine O-acetyltransferase